MAELASRVALGGVEGDTFGDNVIHKVYSDGVYGWVDKALVALGQVVANIAAMPAIGTMVDGQRVTVTTNGLTYKVDNGAYVVTDYETTVVDLAARDALTELVAGQRVYIDALDRTDRWDGTAWIEGAEASKVVALYNDLPDPTTLRVNTKYTVSNDPLTQLNGIHVVLGGVPGAMGTYWDAA